MGKLSREIEFQKRRWSKRRQNLSLEHLVGALALLLLIGFFAFRSSQSEVKKSERTSLSSSLTRPSQELSNSFDPEFKKWADRAREEIRGEKNLRYFQDTKTSNDNLSLKQETTPLASEDKKIFAPTYLPEYSVLYSLQNKERQENLSFVEKFQKNASEAGYGVQIDPNTLEILEVRDLRTGEILPADQVDF